MYVTRPENAALEVGSGASQGSADAGLVTIKIENTEIIWCDIDRESIVALCDLAGDREIANRIRKDPV